MKNVIPDALIYVCTAIGVGCIGNLFLISREYKDKAKKYAEDETSRLLISKSTSEFTKKIKTKSLTIEMVSDFYNQFAKANKPVSMLSKAWSCFLLAGIFFIMTALIGSVNLGGFETLIVLYPISFAIVFLIFALYQLYRLERMV